METTNIILLALDYLLAVGIVVYNLPKIAHTAKIKRLVADTKGRSVAKDIIPNIGGVAIFLGFTLSLILSDYLLEFTDQEASLLVYIIGGSIVILFVGLRDDIDPMSPRTKLMGQLVAVGMVMFLGDIRFTDFFGIFGITAIPYYVSIPFTIFVFAFLLNGFNLIDGIDGLASALVFLISTCYAIWFTLVKDYFYATMAVSLSGTLTAFFYYNVFSKKHKVFMGDTGSLFIGFLVTILTIGFVEKNVDASFPYAVANAPAIALTLLIVPVFDTMRVFGIRLLKNKNPFHADKNHVHHRLLTLGNTHFRATLWIVCANILIVAVVLYLDANTKPGVLNLASVAIVLAWLISHIPAYLINRRIGNVNNKRRQHRQQRLRQQR